MREGAGGPQEEHLWEATQLYNDTTGMRKTPYANWLKELYIEWEEPEKLAWLTSWCQVTEAAGDEPRMPIKRPRNL